MTFLLKVSMHSFFTRVVEPRAVFCPLIVLSLFLQHHSLDRLNVHLQRMSESELSQLASAAVPGLGEHFGQAGA